MTLRIVVIGCGYITLASHGPAYMRLVSEDPDLELSACCDTSVERAETTRQKFGFHRAYTDYLQMLEKERPDAVCLNVPVSLTARMSAKILEAGFPLLAEKPPAMTVAELDALIQTAEAAQIFHQVAFNRRFAPLVQELKRVLEGQSVIHIDHTFTRVQRRDADFSTTAIHGIDTVRWLVGQDFDTLRIRYRDVWVEQEAVQVFVLDGWFQSGAGIHMTFQPVSGRAAERTVVYTPDSTYELSLNHAIDAPGKLTHWHKGVLAWEMDAAQLCGSSEDYILSGFYAEDGAFIDSVKSGAHTSEHNFASARQSVEIMQCLKERREEYRLYP